jgi:hypothetical protein
MNTQSPANEAPRAGLGHRLLGALIMIKAALPLALVALLALGLWQIASGVSHAVDDARSAIEPRLAVVQARIDDVQAEGRRLLDEVKKIENATTEIAGAVKQSVEPIRKSLLGLSGALKTVSATVASLLNAVIRVLNGIPVVKDLPYVSLPHIEIPGITLPKLDIDVNLKPNLEAVRQINETAQEIARQAQQGVDRITETVLFWWWTIKLAAALVVLWVALAVVGYAARVSHRLSMGFRMLCGRRVEGAFALL